MSVTCGWDGSYNVAASKLDLPPCARNRPAFSAFATAGHNKLTANHKTHDSF